MDLNTQKSDNGRSRSPFVPLLLVILTLGIMVGFQSIQLMRERQLLHSRIENQDAPLEEARKVRTQFEAVVKNTYQLAEQGNQNAAAVIERLKQAGVNINKPESAE